MSGQGEKRAGAFVPFHVPSIGEEEIQEVVATLRSGWLTTGERTARFEREYAAYVDAPHALAVNSCTAGLHLALAAMRIGPGDEVITTPLTFCATINTILHVGATPVLADVGEEGNIDPASIAERITPRTRAIMPVHLGGVPCDMEAIWRLARKHNLRVIEDAAHATGSRYGGRPLGSCSGEYASDAVAWSFYATKNITTGEGGMVTTGDAELASRMRILCLHGISKDAWNRYAENGSWYYEVLEPGFKYNLSDLQSAIGIHQLRRADALTALRRARAVYYNERFRDIGEIELPPQGAGIDNSWHLYSIRLNLDQLSIGRDAFMAELKARQVGASVHFIPIPLHPYFAPWADLAHNRCPRAMALWARLVSLPLFPGLRDEQADRVVEAVQEVVREHSRRPTELAAAGSSRR